MYGAGIPYSCALVFFELGPWTCTCFLTCLVVYVICHTTGQGPRQSKPGGGKARGLGPPAVIIV